MDGCHVAGCYLRSRQSRAVPSNPGYPQRSPALALCRCTCRVCVWVEARVRASPLTPRSNSDQSTGSTPGAASRPRRGSGQPRCFLRKHNGSHPPTHTHKESPPAQIHPTVALLHPKYNKYLRSTVCDVIISSIWEMGDRFFACARI